MAGRRDIGAYLFAAKLIVVDGCLWSILVRRFYVGKGEEGNIQRGNGPTSRRQVAEEEVHKRLSHFPLLKR